MFLKHLINPKPSIVIFFIIFCIVFAVLPIVQFKLSSIFYHSYLHPIIIFLASIIIPFFLSTGLNNLIYEKNIIRKGNLVIGFVFIFISSPFINTIEAWVAAFFMLFLFNFLLDSYQKDMPLAQYYNASIILSTLTFVYPNIIFLLILFLVSGINYSNLKWRIIFTILLGLITPYIFYFMFLYLSGNLFFIPDFFNLSLISFSDIEKIQLPKKIWLSVLLLITVFSFFELFMWLYKKSIKSRKTFIIIIWYFIITIWTAFFSNIEYFYFSLTPLAIIIGNYFVYTRNRKIAKILFFMLVISSFYYKYMIAYYM